MFYYFKFLDSEREFQLSFARVMDRVSLSVWFVLLFAYFLPFEKALALERTLSEDLSSLCHSEDGKEVPVRHGIAMHGSPALPPDFPHLPTANPEAPKGGRITYGVQGSFDSLNPFIVKSMATSARGLWDPEFGNLVYESLLERNHNENFSLYGLLAESVRLPEKRDWISFTLHPEARFSDGMPVTAEDVLFSFKLLLAKGKPSYRRSLQQVKHFKELDSRTICLVFKEGSDRELPFLMGLLPIFAKHTLDPLRFDQSTLIPPVASGPYRITEIQPGRSITYTRNPAYWARALPIRRGLYNYDEVKVLYFKDSVSLFESFKKGRVDLLREGNPAHWMTAYAFPAALQGKVVQHSFPTAQPKDFYGMVFNTRHPLLSDRRVRQALGLVLDFEWINKNFYHGKAVRSSSFFESASFSAIGRPADAQERTLLAPFPDSVLPSVLNGSWRPPASNGSGLDRNNLRQALALLEAAGFTLTAEGLIHRQTGQKLCFEILVQTRDQERMALAYQTMLRSIGGEVLVRKVDELTYQFRLQNYAFDMIFRRYTVSFSPGNEQKSRWGTQAAHVPGTFNFAGVSDPAVDALIDALLEARTRKDFESAVRALDRVLISGNYVIPLFYLPDLWIAHWDHLQAPEGFMVPGTRLEMWWDAAATPSNSDSAEKKGGKAQRKEVFDRRPSFLSAPSSQEANSSPGRN